MVYSAYLHCDECMTTTVHHNNKCVACSERKERMKDAAWEAQSVHEKLIDIHKRLKKIENYKPIKY